MRFERGVPISGTPYFLRKNVLTKRSNNCRLQIESLMVLDQRRKATLEELRLGAVESQFADIIWNEEPVSSVDLV